MPKRKKIWVGFGPKGHKDRRRYVWCYLFPDLSSMRAHLAKEIGDVPTSGGWEKANGDHSNVLGMHVPVHKITTEAFLSKASRKTRRFKVKDLREPDIDRQSGTVYLARTHVNPAIVCHELLHAAMFAHRHGIRRARQHPMVIKDPNDEERIAYALTAATSQFYEWHGGKG